MEYKDAKAEFRVAKSFGNFIFELPEDVNASEYQGDVFVISSADRELFDDLEAFTVEDFGGYFVAYK